MKLIANYYIVDSKGRRLTELSADFGPAHIRAIFEAYSAVYSTDGPMRIVAVDVLGEEQVFPEDC